MDLQAELLDKMGTASTRLEDIADEMQRQDAQTKAELARIKASVATRDNRSAAVRSAIGGNYIGGGNGRSRREQESNGFLKAVMQARSTDYAEQMEGKAALEDYEYRTPEQVGSKATLGSTAATGGWVIPGPLVDDLVKPAEYANPYRQLITIRTGVNSADVDIPFRSAAPTRAAIAAWGETKDNRNLAYNGYTATMYTLAAIYDLSNQFLRHSAGAAQADVMEELGHALGLGEAYYIRDGSGTSQPYGFITALTNAPATFTTSHSPVTTTVAGSVAAAIAKAAGALIARNRRPQAAVISPSGFTALMTDGADTAGFFLSGIAGPQSVPGFAPGTLVSPWGIPVVVDPEFTADDLVVGEWTALKLFVGDGPRVDSSDQAGERWDRNLTGFRGEEEIAFDARPAVFAGALQLVQDVIA